MLQDELPAARGMSGMRDFVMRNKVGQGYLREDAGPGNAPGQP
jgi:hypothetical protein